LGHAGGYSRIHGKASTGPAGVRVFVDWPSIRELVESSTGGVLIAETMPSISQARLKLEMAERQRERKSHEHSRP